MSNLRMLTDEELRAEIQAAIDAHNHEMCVPSIEALAQMKPDDYDWSDPRRHLLDRTHSLLWLLDGKSR